MASDVKVTEGAGKNIACFSITEDGETKQIQRVVLCDSSGTELNDLINHLIKINLATALVGEDAVNNALRVEGVVAEGVAAAGNPALLGAKDETGKIRSLLTSKGALNNYVPTDGTNVLAVHLFAGNKDSGVSRVDFVDNHTEPGVTDLVGAATANFPSLYLGQNTWQFQRTANTFKTATATASGNTAVWSPQTGKKFRLMKFRIDVPANAAISGGGVIVDITFQDGTTDLGIGLSVFVPATAVTTTVGGFTSGWVTLDNGILSAAANNVLNINLSATLTTGKVRVSVAGTEE